MIKTMIIKCKIDVKKIAKEKLFQGKTALYLDCTLLENRDGVDQYGNSGMIVQDVTKAEREAGTRGAILGNFKIMGQNQPAKKPAARPAAPVAGDAPPENDDVPF
jgi:hypothetical protein